MSNLSALGRFQLGSVQLGASLGSVSHSDSIKVSEGIPVSFFSSSLESLSCTELDWINMIASNLEAIEMLQEFLWYPVLDEIGVQVRIVQLIDITMEDFCAHVYEAGHAILVNGENARAFVTVLQKEETFRGNVKVYAGDAIMFSCPSLALAIGDTITHAFREYQIVEIHEKLIGGNYIYLKSALKLLSLPVTMPKVTGLKVSENQTGSVVITWDDISRTLYPSFDHFEIWRSGVHPITGVDQVLKTFNILGEYAAFFTVGETFDVIGSTGNDGTYTIVSASELSGVTIIEVLEAIPSAVIDGFLDKLLFRITGTSKTSSFTDKNLVAGGTYYYMVRAIDKYGNAGDFSEVVGTSGVASTPTTPEGLR